MAKRYSHREKVSLLGRYRRLRESGKTAQQAARAVKVSYITLRKWEKGTEKPSTSIKKTSVADSFRGTGICLTTPEGYRIETESPEQMAEILNLLRR